MSSNLIISTILSQDIVAVTNETHNLVQAGSTPAPATIWRVRVAAERACLENKNVSDGVQGSNP